MSTDDGNFRSTSAQVLASMALNTLMVNVGMTLGMPVFVIGALRLGDPALSFTEEQASWFGGMVYMIQPLGSLVSGFLQDLLGRRTTMMIVNIPQLVAWIMIYKASSVTMLFAAIIILGLSLGFMEAPVHSYIGEVSEPRLRGILSTLGGVFYKVGHLVVGFIGAAAGWRLMALITSAAPVISFVCLAMVPESPAWLVSKGRTEKARRSYQWLRGWVPPQVVQQELDALVRYVDSTRRPTVVQYHQVPTSEGKLQLIAENAPESKLQLFLSPSVQRPLRLIVFFFIISSSASLAAMRPFFMEVLSNLELPISSNMFIVFYALLTVLGAMTTTLILRRTGKRVITFISLGVCTACCLGLGTYLSLGLHLPWLPLALFSVSSYASTVGITFVPWVLICELFPLRARGMASGVAGALGYLAFFTNIKTYYTLVSMVNMSGACFLYGAVGLLGFIYLYFNLPETEGATLESIEKIYSQGDHKHLPRTQLSANNEVCASP